ncbi:MAG: histidine phosphatase family protein [Candidatus Altiarchaeum hamiconexum]|uniref:Histidine phosphatase family protein n=1 Tax=Candidatus Altarchaeum hamiconexum TaxID=1803513 RepID=A0A8J7YZJ6_9ARCH|nr:histidine phosphatase family protein [Candidatus Altarchaeum hamiconexum]NCN69267.1 histidine phosphatase family protein [Candidatus Altarchaeum hamiconexum]NCS91406.1 histidine phosphatase family protein [Candidatus Altarchaeum hamiconexum]NCT01011.1 histidine phosphatase family protein [Candidatus Altarchaeum hamiconexum]OIQ06344.1 MAG: hypothetical protein AUK59_00265 [Candidatus Altarchaeum sp. CG2_30_32_3053]
MLRIILIRHCETEWAVEGRYQGNIDVPLSPLGRKNAKLLADKIKTYTINHNYRISKIYSGCLSRAYQTAEIISKSINFKGHVEKICELNERNFGDWEGLTYSEISSKYGKSKTDKYLNNPLNFSIPNAESFEDFKERVSEGINFILNENNDKVKDNASNYNNTIVNTILVVAHGGTNRLIICMALNLSQENFFRLKQDLGCINIIENYENLSVVVLMNGKI